ncbi:hypothetical protein [Bradyrhizobium sp. 190]|uniref:hypothetical protein n=1 Tax=Bradyrhizobium sp. 190 TaxID=2782658 RepID=UPI001FF72FFD|nr:hypothetical protein [Bradyrhizobium sp. 190]
MEGARVRIYTDYKSPYAFVADKRLFELEEICDAELEWLPYTLRIPEFMGTVEERTPHFWRKVRYAYMDARRYANAQGLTMEGPRRRFLFQRRHQNQLDHLTISRRIWRKRPKRSLAIPIAWQPFPKYGSSRCRKKQSEKIWAAGSAHTLKSFGVEGISIDALLAFAMRDPQATDCSNSAFAANASSLAPLRSTPVTGAPG